MCHAKGSCHIFFDLADRRLWVHIPGAGANPFFYGCCDDPGIFFFCSTADPLISGKIDGRDAAQIRPQGIDRKFRCNAVIDFYVIVTLQVCGMCKRTCVGKRCGMISNVHCCVKTLIDPCHHGCRMAHPAADQLGSFRKQIRKNIAGIIMSVPDNDSMSCLQDCFAGCSRLQRHLTPCHLVIFSAMFSFFPLRHTGNAFNICTDEDFHM